MSRTRTLFLMVMISMIWQPLTAYASDADLQLVIHAPQTTWHVGEQVLITAEIENLSANRAEGVTLIATLPDALRFVSSSDCQAVGQAIACGVGQIQSGQVGRISLVLRGDVAQADVLLQAQVVATTEDHVAENNITTLTIQVLDAPEGDLALRWLNNPTSGFVGQTLTYSLQAENIGTDTAYEVTLTVAIPEPLQFNTISDRCQVNSLLLTCTHAQLASTETIDWQFTLTPTTVMQDARLVASVRMSGADRDDSNQHVDHLLTITHTPPTTADLQLTLTPPVGTWAVGNYLNLAATVRNAGPADASGITLITDLPDSLQFVGSNEACLDDAGQVRCTLSALAVDTDIVINLRLQLRTIGETVTIPARVSASESDAIPENNAQTLVLSAGGLALPTSISPLSGSQNSNPIAFTNPTVNATPVPMSSPTPSLPPSGSGVRNTTGDVPSSVYGWRRYESADLIQVTGQWDLRTMSNASDRGYHETRSAGATLRYPFEGDGFRVGYRSTVYGAPFHLFLDGVLVDSYQTDYAFFVSQTDEQRRTYLTDPVFIEGGYHVLDIVALADGEGSEAVNIDFVEIFSGPPIPEQPIQESIVTPIPMPTRVTDIEVIAMPPTPIPTNAPPTARIIMVDVFIAVDHNNNDTREPNEGVADVPIQAVDAAQNRLLTTALTDATGFARVQVVSERDVVLLIPLLNESFMVRLSRGNETIQEQWELLLDPAQLPGLIP